MTIEKKQRKKRRNLRAESNTINEVAAKLGVSTATISRVVNNKPGVGPELREKLQQAILELNFVPRASARDLTKAQSQMLGAVFQDLTAGWLLTIYHGILSKCTEMDYHLITSVSTRQDDAFDMAYRMCAGQRIDGLIWLDPRLTSSAIRRISKLNVPFVLLQTAPDHLEFNTVTIHDEECGYIAMRHLLKLGYRDLMLITGPVNSPDSRHVLCGVERALKEADITIPPHRILCGKYNGLHAARMLSSYLQAGHPPPRAILAFNDVMALAVLHRLRACGMRVPEDVALMGIDGIEEGVSEGLTTIDTPMWEMGRLATQLLLDMIDKPNLSCKPHQIRLSGTLRVRSTCGA